jgi:hypothetical protein
MEWVREFLKPPNHGLDVLIDLLTATLLVFRQRLKKSIADQEEDFGSTTKKPIWGTMTLDRRSRQRSNSLNLESKHPLVHLFWWDLKKKLIDGDSL